MNLIDFLFDYLYSDGLLNLIEDLLNLSLEEFNSKGDFAELLRNHQPRMDVEIFQRSGIQVFMRNEILLDKYTAVRPTRYL